MPTAAANVSLCDPNQLKLQPPGCLASNASFHPSSGKLLAPLRGFLSTAWRMPDSGSALILLSRLELSLKARIAAVEGGMNENDQSGVDHRAG